MRHRSWKEGPLKRWLSVMESGGREPGGGNQLVSGDEAVFSFGGEHIGWTGEITLDPPKFVSAEFYSRMRRGVLREDDVVLVKDGATIGKVAHFRKLPFPKCAINEHVYLFRPAPTVLPRYLAYFLWSSPAQETIRNSMRGSAQPGLNAAFAAEARMAAPAIQEQEGIVAWLDRETGGIDGLIEKKERLLALLEEKRQALVSRAITKGVDFHMPMKKSDLPSIPEVPLHWAIQRNKAIFAEINDPSVDGSEELLTVSHLSGVTRRSEKQVYMFEAETNEGYKRCRAGDLVINTMWAWMGAAGVAREPGIVSPAYAVYRPIAPVLPEYYDLLIRSREYVTEMARFSKGVWRSRLRLYPDDFLSLRTLVPPLQDQRDIVDHVRAVTDKQNALCEKLERSIALLRERRQAIISAAVTNQLHPNDYLAANEVSA